MRRQMASPIENYLQQVIRSRYALARQPTGLRSGTQFSTAYRSERSERVATPMGVLRTILNKG